MCREGETAKPKSPSEDCHGLLEGGRRLPMWAARVLSRGQCEGLCHGCGMKADLPVPVEAGGQGRPG